MSNIEYGTLIPKARGWIEGAVAQNWLPRDALHRFDQIERGTPGELFRDGAARPLVVALFGGTGVGKSTLLNRLAGAEIARAGVERPTSREVTLYAHEAVALADLPSPLLAQVRIHRHAHAQRRDVLWIDSPDIDSTEESNRRLALSWLPHVDLVIYVMSPERYRDDVGWRVLQQRGQRHGWMFVLNRWDEGDPRQIEDLASILRRAGFENPLLFHTSCAKQSVQIDQFGHIEATLQTLLSEHAVREFDRLGWSARLATVLHGFRTELMKLADGPTWDRRRANWRLRWEHHAAAIREGLIWPIQAAAGRFAVRERGMLSRISGAVRKPAQTEAEKHAASAAQPSEIAALTRGLWDEWAVARLDEFADAIESEMLREGHFAERTRETFRSVSQKAESLVLKQVQDELRVALARPGTRLQRALERAASFLSVLLPGLALLWIALRVVQSFYEAGDSRAYLDSNFAIHSFILVLVCWLIPFGVGRLMKPSLTEAARNGMLRGLESGLASLGAQYDAAIESTAAECAALRSEGETIAHHLAQFERAPRTTPAGSSVDRAMMRKGQLTSQSLELL